MLMNALSTRGLASGFAALLLFLATAVYFHIPVPKPVKIANSFHASTWTGEPRFSHYLRNRTLGFEKIFAIGFPNRGDRRDALTIASSLTGIDITRADAVSFADMAEKSIHENWLNKPGFNTTGVHSLVASQRAHFNVLDHIVENHISTALILEDDVDWDYHLKDQVEAIATAFRGLQEDGTRNVETGSPYGNNWDVLWLGHCRSGPQEHEELVYVIENDLTVPPVSKRHSQWKSSHIPDVLTQDHTRLAFKVQRGTCTFGYGVTYHGAQKILAGLSLTGNAQPFDSAMNDLFRGAIKPKLQAYGIYPPIFSSHRTAGPLAKDSDISDYGTSGGQRHDEYSWDIVFSMIQNAQRLLSGATTVLSQWPGVTTVDEMAIAEPLHCNVTPTRITWKDLPVFTHHPVQFPDR